MMGVDAQRCARESYERIGMRRRARSKRRTVEIQKRIQARMVGGREKRHAHRRGLHVPGMSQEIKYPCDARGASGSIASAIPKILEKILQERNRHPFEFQLADIEEGVGVAENAVGIAQINPK